MKRSRAIFHTSIWFLFFTTYKHVKKNFCLFDRNTQTFDGGRYSFSVPSVINLDHIDDLRFREFNISIPERRQRFRSLCQSSRTATHNVRDVSASTNVITESVVDVENPSNSNVRCVLCLFIVQTHVFLEALREHIFLDRDKPLSHAGVHTDQNPPNPLCNFDRKGARQQQFDHSGTSFLEQS